MGLQSCGKVEIGRRGRTTGERGESFEERWGGTRVSDIEERGKRFPTCSMSSLFLLVLLAPATLLSAPARAEIIPAKQNSLFVPASSLSYEALTLKYGVETLDEKGVEKYLDENGLNGRSHRTMPQGTSFLQIATKALAKVGVIANGCEICNYVMENKQMHQPFLCRGLKDPAQQQTVSFCQVKSL